VQVATPHASFLEAYLGDVVEIRRSDTPENLDLDLRGAARPGARFDERLTAAAAPRPGRRARADRAGHDRRTVRARAASGRRTPSWSSCSTGPSPTPGRTAPSPGSPRRGSASTLRPEIAAFTTTRRATATGAEPVTLLEVARSTAVSRRPSGRNLLAWPVVRLW
jgi:hypothetical protein